MRRWGRPQRGVFRSRCRFGGRLIGTDFVVGSRHRVLRLGVSRVLVGCRAQVPVGRGRNRCCVSVLHRVANRIGRIWNTDRANSACGFQRSFATGHADAGVEIGGLKDDSLYQLALFKSSLFLLHVGDGVRVFRAMEHRLGVVAFQ